MLLLVMLLLLPLACNVITSGFGSIIVPLINGTSIRTGISFVEPIGNANLLEIKNHWWHKHLIFL